MTQTEQERQRKIDYLMSYKWLNAEIREDERRLAAIDDRLYGVSAQRLSDMPKGGQPVTMDAIIADKMELQAAINAKALKRRMIVKTIETMPSERDRRILKLKFVDDLTHEQVAERIQYSAMTARRFYETALEHFPKVEQ